MKDLLNNTIVHLGYYICEPKSLKREINMLIHISWPFESLGTLLYKKP